tara:strand:+ start:407 stop:706 length:300 start_codon:yes stop_codon:yes gene_type:complete
MATYAELFELHSNSPLRNKVAVAVVVKAQDLIDGATPTADEITWADAALGSPSSKAKEILNYVLAKNKGSDIATILAASDATIQSNIDTAVDALIAGGA